MTPIWAACVLTLVVLLGDRPLTREAGYGTPTGRAALVYRDRENAFFQWGTRIYTEPLLTPHYAEVIYVTERRRGDRARLLTAARGLLDRHGQVDVFLAVHGSRGLHHDFKRLPNRDRLGLVYSTGCADGRFGDRWLQAGADAFVGHDGQWSVSPLFYVYFLRRWIEGHPLADAVAQANAQMRLRLGWGVRLIAGRAIGESLVAQTTARVDGDTALRIGR